MGAGSTTGGTHAGSPLTSDGIVVRWSDAVGLGGGERTCETSESDPELSISFEFTMIDLVEMRRLFPKNASCQQHRLVSRDWPVMTSTQTDAQYRKNCVSTGAHIDGKLHLHMMH